MFRRSACTPTLLWSLPRIVFEADESGSAASTTAAAALAASNRADEAASRTQRVANLCGGGGNSNSLYNVVNGSSALKRFVETMPQADALLSQPVLDRKRRVVASLCTEQEKRVLLAKQQLRAAKRQLRMLRKQRKAEMLQEEQRDAGHVAEAKAQSKN